MPNFRFGLAFDFVDLGWPQAAWVGDDRYSARFDINPTLNPLTEVRFDIILTPCRQSFPEVHYLLVEELGPDFVDFWGRSDHLTRQNLSAQLGGFDPHLH